MENNKNNLVQWVSFSLMNLNFENIKKLLDKFQYFTALHYLSIFISILIIMTIIFVVWVKMAKITECSSSNGVLVENLAPKN